MRFGKGLRDQRDPDDDLGSGADPGEKAVNAELERRMRQSLEPGEDAVDEDTERQRAYPADIVGDDPEHEAAERPAEQPDGADNSADSADIGNARLPAQQLGQGRPKHERKQPEIGCVERPAGPRDKEHQPLIPGDDAYKPQ